MLASSITRAVRLASRQHMQLISSRFSSTPCSSLHISLPGAYREPTELWHDGTAEGPTEVKTITSEADLKSLITGAAAEPDSLVVVKFHSKRCNASRAIEGEFRRTAAEFATEIHEATFAEVCFDSNRKLCEKMDICSVPHVQIFSGASGKVADFSIAPGKYNTLSSLLADRRNSLRVGK